MASAIQDRFSLHSFTFSLSSPTQERKKLHRGSVNFDFNRAMGEGGKHHHSKRHKKSKGHRGRKRDCFSLNLEPNDNDDPSPHPLCRATMVKSAHTPTSCLPTSSADCSGKQDNSPEGGTTKISPSRGLTKAVVTDLDGFGAWGGDFYDLASVDKTLPSSAVPRETAAQPTQSSSVATDESSSGTSTEPSAAHNNTPTRTTDGGVVLRRGISLPEGTSRRGSNGSLQFVRELGLVQIKEDGTRGLRPRSAVLLSDSSEPDLMAVVVRAAMSSSNGQKALLSKAMKRRSTDFGERVKSNSSLTLHATSDTDPVDCFKNGDAKIGKGRPI